MCSEYSEQNPNYKPIYKKGRKSCVKKLFRKSANSFFQLVFLLFIQHLPVRMDKGNYVPLRHM